MTLKKVKGFWNSVKAFLGKLAGNVIALFLNSFIAPWVLKIFTRFLNCRIWTFILHSFIMTWILKIFLHNSTVTKRILKIFEAFLNWFMKKDPVQFIQDKVSRDEVTLELAEELLEIIIHIMKVNFKIDPDFRKNIEGFKAKYHFRSKNVKPDKSLALVVEFKEGDLDVKEIKKPLITDEELEKEEIDVTVIFKNGKALINYLLLILAREKDMLRMVIDNEIVIMGNVNYTMKFQYMANHLLLAFTGRLT